MINRSVLAIAVLSATVGIANAQNAEDVLVGSNVRVAKELYCVLTNLSSTTPLTVKLPTVVDASGNTWPLSRKRVLIKPNYGMYHCHNWPPKQEFSLIPGRTCYLRFGLTTLPEEPRMVTCKMYVDKPEFFRGYANVDSIDVAGSTAIK